MNEEQDITKEIDVSKTLSEKEITKIFRSGKLSSTVIIPIRISRRQGLEKPAHVIVEEKDGGVMIRKLEI
jgi:hypothetical protein